MVIVGSWSAFYSPASCDVIAIICGMTVVTWFDASNNQRPFRILLSTFRNSAFYSLPSTANVNLSYTCTIVVFVIKCDASMLLILRPSVNSFTHLPYVNLKYDFDYSLTY